MKHLYPYLRRFRKESILAPLFKMLAGCRMCRDTC